MVMTMNFLSFDLIYAPSSFQIQQTRAHTTGGQLEDQPMPTVVTIALSKVDVHQTSQRLMRVVLLAEATSVPDVSLLLSLYMPSFHFDKICLYSLCTHHQFLIN